MEPCMALSAEENPPELLAPLDDPMVLSRQWCVVQTRSRREKKLAWCLARMGIPYFLPMVRTKTVSRNEVANPMFAGILFATYDPHDGTLDRIRATHHQSGYLFTRNQTRLRQELAMLAHGCITTRSLREEPRHFRVGDSVRIFQGPMKGLEGRVAQPGDSSKPRLYVELLLIGRLVSVEIDPRMVASL
jgi:transcription antitermination factor NusG